MTKVKICCGTSCYIMGSSDLIVMDLSCYINVEIEGTTCMNLCKDHEKRPPYVNINGVLHAQVTPTKLLELIEEVESAI
ncbi:MAG: hypothetical protein OCD02_06445 [Spirochaetaceae bacterium]